MSPNERIAHDILCVAKYGSPGGTAYADEVKRMQRYLEGAGILQAPVRAPAVRVAIPKVTVSLTNPPTIRIGAP